MPAIVDRPLKVTGSVTSWKEKEGAFTESRTVTLTSLVMDVTIKASPLILEGLEKGETYRLQIIQDQTKLPIEEQKEKSYKCRYCGETFAKPLELAKHVKTTHKKEDQEE